MTGDSGIVTSHSNVLRINPDAKLSHQQTAHSLGLSMGVFTKYAGLANAAGLDWPEVQDMEEAALERRLLLGAPEGAGLRAARLWCCTSAVNKVHLQRRAFYQSAGLRHV